MSGDNQATYYTCIDKEYYEFKWVISDYSLIFTKVTGIDSHIFTVGSDEEKKFQLKLCSGNVVVSGYNETSRCLSLHVAEMAGQFIMKYKLSVMTGEKIVDTRIGHSTCQKGGVIHMLNIQIEEFKKFVSSTDSIIFHCKLTLSKGSIINSLNDENAKMNQVLKLKFDWIFLNKDLSDIKLETACGKEIPAHRVVLAAASPVFRAMFTHDMLEKKSQSIGIDVNYEAAVEMLRYFYTGTIESREISLIIDLLLTADKYQVDELKIECEKILKSKISSENAINILQIADKCQMNCLKKNVVDFIKQHISVSSDSDDVGDMILNMERLFSK
ncbi:hypothetical protein TKK_0004598 [Trichogramma kaykai]|uniref:BTB domain-containing protein n=1 Tax=Trichogramma kaykai TaxID=54128 RepID=A0ABD2XNW2_9HYME